MDWTNIVKIILSGIAIIIFIILTTINDDQGKYFMRCLSTICLCVWTVNFTISILIQCGMTL